MSTTISRRRGSAVAALLIVAALLFGVTACSGTGRSSGEPSGQAGDREIDAVGHVSADLPSHDPEIFVENPDPRFPATVETVDGDVTVESADRILTLDRAGALSRMVYSMGMGDRLVGRDTASDFPAIEDLPQVTPGGHSINAETVMELRPDLVIADGSIGPSRVLQTLRSAGVAVIEVSGDRTPETVNEMVHEVAGALGLSADADDVADQIDAQIAEAAEYAQAKADGRSMMILYLRGTSVAMIAGPESGGGELIEMLGGVDAAEGIGIGGSFTNLTPEALVQAAPDTVIVMSGGLESIGGAEAINELPGMSQTPAGQNLSVLDVPDSQLLSFGPDTATVIRAMADALYGEG